VIGIHPLLPILEYRADPESVTSKIFNIIQPPGHSIQIAPLKDSSLPGISAFRGEVGIERGSVAAAVVEAVDEEKIDKNVSPVPWRGIDLSMGSKSSSEIDLELLFFCS
jgi:hypothetical protein